MYKIKWKSTKTGKTGEGAGIFPKKQAEEIVRGLNNDNRGVTQHWIEEVIPEQGEENGRTVL